MQASRSWRRHGTPSCITPSHFSSGSLVCCSLIAFAMRMLSSSSWEDSTNVRALIIGGSIAGLIAGLLFRKAGFAVVVHERAVGNLAGRGAGLGVSQELLDVMARAGAPFEPSAGVAQHAHV